MIAQTILHQLGGSRFQLMTGAKNFLNLKNGLSFRIPSTMTKQKINYVKIELNGLDLYDLEFGRIWKLDYKIVKTLENIDSAQLQRVFTQVTGLDTHL